MSGLKSTLSRSGVGSTILSSAYNGALYRRYQQQSIKSLRILSPRQLGICHSPKNRTTREVGGILHCRPSTFCCIFSIIAGLPAASLHESLLSARFM